jgi:hypothetical protein
MIEKTQINKSMCEWEVESEREREREGENK